ncbi:hypothetical protein BDZ97DRAFT_2055970 [Flammula alnicola]|nr:hypothetical protein BDZ97DRAFT_2055970 [Flammula alnicola]
MPKAAAQHVRRRGGMKQVTITKAQLCKRTQDGDIPTHAKTNIVHSPSSTGKLKKVRLQKLSNDTVPSISIHQLIPHHLQPHKMARDGPSAFPMTHTSQGSHAATNTTARAVVRAAYG